MPQPDEPLVSGWAPFTTLDVPGRLAATFFLRGCPLRCRYCHNVDLQARRGTSPLRWLEALTWLDQRRGLLDSVVFSGGEPTMDRCLEQMIRDVRSLGFEVALHTAGVSPKRLGRVLPLLQWVGLDIKAPFGDYARITGSEASGARARVALAMLRESGVPYEVRTTVHPALLDAQVLQTLALDLRASGIGRWVLQPFCGRGCVEPALSAENISIETSLVTHLRRIIPEIVVRSNGC